MEILFKYCGTEKKVRIIAALQPSRVKDGGDHNKTAAGEGRQEYCETISINS